MQITPICSNYNSNNKINTQPKFNGLIKDVSALPIINSMSKKDILELEQIEKRLAKTKFWDMKISAIKDQVKEFLFQFIDKKDNNGIITNGIFPYDKHDDTIKIYTIVYGPENIHTNAIGALKFKSKKRADEIYENYMQNIEFVRNRNFHLTPIESIKSKEIELNMLEESRDLINSTNNLNILNSTITTKEHVGNDFKIK